MRLFFSLVILFLSFVSQAQHYFLFIGTYTKGKSEGIYVYDFDSQNGKAVRVSTTKSSNPSYLTISPRGNFLYAVNENGTAGEVSAFSFDRKSGRLQFLNRTSSGGADPCYISENSTSTWLFVANYTSGTLSAIPVLKDGKVDSLRQVIQDTGTGPVTDRQEKAHVHSAVLSPDEHFLFAADLGADRHFSYRVNPAAHKPLTPSTPPFVSVLPGTGPRHFVFHPKKPYAYLIGELSGTVDAFKYRQGNLTPLQRVSTHPADYKGQIGSADIHVTPDGRFLYASNRGDANSLAIFSLDTLTGKLRNRGFQPTGGKTPRNFMIDPHGRFLLVANQNSDNIVIFRIRQNGMLEDTGNTLSVPNPVCLKMLKK
jgi:6-phosphogluconolactonase